MNRIAKPLTPRTLFCRQISRHCSAYAQPTTPTALAMKPGAPITGLNFMKGSDPPVAKERSEYPEWVNELAKPPLTLAKLRRLPFEESTDADQMRYLKLTRRVRIKKHNLEAND